MNQKAIKIATDPAPPPLRTISSSTPWVETILAEGPDVMFEVLDLDSSDDCLEVISAHFFGQKLSVHSIKAIPDAPFIEISAMKTLDTIGRPYGLCLATMTPTPSKQKEKDSSSIQADYSSCDNSEPTHLLVSTHECSYDIPSAYNMALSALGGIYPSIITGAAFAFRNGQQSVRPGLEDVGDVRGGSLFSYEIPRLKGVKKDALSSIGASNVLNAPPINNSPQDTRRTDVYNEDRSAGRVASISSPIVRNRADILDAVDSSANAVIKGEGDGEVEPWVPLVIGAVAERYVTSPDITQINLFYRLNQADFVTLNSLHIAVNNLSSQFPLHPLRSTSLNWKRQTLFRGFKVCGWGGIFSPGAPGFPYVFRMPNKPQVT